MRSVPLGLEQRCEYAQVTPAKTNGFIDDKRVIQLKHDKNTEFCMFCREYLKAMAFFLIRVVTQFASYCAA